jgi:hypothetical protein
VFIETGTYLGTTTAAMARRFRSIYTVELDLILWAQAQDRFSAFPNIHVVQGDSGEVLPRILESVTERCLFWLDGHFSGGNTAGADRVAPIVQELVAIAGHGRRDHVILIDDARRFTGRGGFPVLGSVVALLREVNPGYAIRLRDDILQAYPLAAARKR